MLTIQRLDESSLQSFLLLLPPGIRRESVESQSNTGQIILGASFWGQPAGAAVLHTQGMAGQLTDLYVLPAYRKAGIGAALLAAVEEEAVRAGAGKIHALYRPDEHTSVFKRILARRGWTPPSLQSLVFWTKRELDALSLPWVQKYHFRPPYEVIPWPDVTAAERAHIARRGEEGWYASDLNPFARPVEAWDPETSLGLRHNGEMVGWVLTVREAPLQLLIEILFVDPPLQRLGKGFMLIGEVTRRCWQIGMEDMYWRASPDNEPMVRWSRKAFPDTLSDEFEEWYSEKALNGGG